jgi:hypothetical protein
VAFNEDTQKMGHLFYAVPEGEAAPLLGDGKTYSRAMGWQSPEGNFLFQERWVRDWPSPVVWNGEDYEVIEAVGTATSFSALPMPGQTNPNTGLPYGARSDFEIWSIPRITPVDTTNMVVYDARTLDYCYWDTESQSWKLITWFHDITDGEDALPRPGYKKGAAHVLYYYDIKVYWDGYVWRRPSIDTIDLLGNALVPDGFLEQTTESIEGLVTGQGALDQRITTELSAVNEDISTLSGQISNAIADTQISFAEATLLKTSLAQAVTDSAGLADDAARLGITTEKIAFNVALTNLVNAFSVWLDPLSLAATITLDEDITLSDTHTDSNTYPITILEADQINISNCFKLFQAAQVTLQKAIDVIQFAHLTDTVNTVKSDLIDAFKEADIPLGSDWEDHICQARVVYESPTSVGLEATVDGKVGAVWVNGELIVDDEVGTDAITLLNTHPVLTWDEFTDTVSYTTIQPDTEYTIYLANHSSLDFVRGGRDARGKLFLSLTPNVSGYLGSSGAGLNARAVGQINTDSSSPPNFKREIDISWISKVTSFPETYREYCDYQLEFVDETSIRLKLVDGLYGQLCIAGQLLLFGTNTIVTIFMPRVTWTGNGVLLDQTTISPSTAYYVYACNSADIWNFNVINEATSRPWQESDANSYGVYDSTLDIRKTIFLSTKVQEHSILSETYPGYYARHIGQIQTDAGGFFKNATDISAIRGLTLNPVHLSGLAEISFINISNSRFRVVQKTGTSGIVYVNGDPVYFYDANDLENATKFIVDVSDYTYSYDEGDINSPLTQDVAANTVVTSSIYVYLANSRSMWGALSSQLFMSTQAPSAGYLSSNWPGNNARWMCTIQLAPSSVGSELVTNSTFESDASWTWGTGWTYDGADKKAAHTTAAATAALSQAITVEASGYYELITSMRDRNAGGVLVSLGGTPGQVLWTNTTVKQYILATNTDGLVFTPTELFDGSLDNVYCKKVSTGQLSGSYITSSVSAGGATINDQIISSNETWSSEKFMGELNKLAVQFGLSNDSLQQSQSGLPLLLEYYSSNQVRIKCTDTLPVSVVFPDLSEREINSEGIISGTLTGSINTTYYVYMEPITGSVQLSVSTSAPDGV